MSESEQETDQEPADWKRILPAVLWAACILALSFMSRAIEDAIPVISGNVLKQLLHLGGYAILGSLTARALHLGGRGLSPRASFWTAALFCIFFAAIGEALCGLSQGKTSAEDACWRSDAIGATAGIWLWAMNLTRLQKRCDSSPLPAAGSSTELSEAEKAKSEGSSKSEEVSAPSAGVDIKG